MSSTPRQGAQLFVEPLEARIAPTGLVALTNPDPTSAAGTTDPNFITYKSGTAQGGLHFQPGTDYGVAGNNVYAIKLTGDGTVNPNTNLSTGDRLLIYNSVTGFNQNNPSLQAANGSLVAFFHDANNDGLVQNSELVGISASKNASINVNGSVNGPIIDNLTGNGTLKLAGAQKTKFTIGNLNITGDVTGDILAGGSIGSFSIVGNVHGILTGTAANNSTYSLTGDPAVATGTFRGNAPADGVAGPSIGTVGLISSVGSIGDPTVPGDGVFHTGDGGRNAPGGSITGLTVQNDTNGFALLTGNGGNGDINAPAGQGGSVVNFLVRGVFDSTAASPAKVISVTTGHGGDNGDTKGAKGGAISGVAIGYDPGFDFDNNSGSVSVDHLGDVVILQAGTGGGGGKGGKGGAVNLVNVVTAAADDGGTNHAETQILSGPGGVSFKPDNPLGGHGGDMSAILAQNLLLPADGVTPGSILVQAGDGGAARPGGSISGVTLLGQHLTVNAGNGGGGIGHGGGGGSVTGVVVENLANLFATQVSINAGSGGMGNGYGGNGGNIDTVTVTDSRLGTGGLTINGGNGGKGNADGNNDDAGIGGTGGTVNNVNVADASDAPINAANGIVAAAPAAPVMIHSGNGGDGTSGNVGGTLTNTTVIGTNLTFAVTSGSGGSVTGSGNGSAGAGGAIVSLNLSDQPVEVFNLTTTAVSPTGMIITTVKTSTIAYSGNTATVASGNGGNSYGGTAGAGGDITQLDVVTNVNVTPQPNLVLPAGTVPDNDLVTSGKGGNAGVGGDGTIGSAGKGGDMTSPVVQSIFGSVSLRSGDGGSNGGTGADGGTINGAVLRGLGTLSLIGGNGGAGGAGGSITNSGTTLTSTSSPDGVGNNVVRATNNEGGLLVQAGNGSVGAVAGAGGSVTNFSGYVSSGGTTSIIGGDGGSGEGKISGAGGGVNAIKLTGVNDGIATGSIINLDAGDAGTSAKSKRGSAGGDVTGINLYNLDAGTVVHHIAAGDGSAGKKTGGNGGSITQVSVGLATEPVDIGYRSGHVFGYNQDQSGGVFAGAAGTSGQVAGTSGNVTDVTAAAIASIVAGKSGDLGFSRLANKVDAIYLTGLQPANANADGSFTNFDAANVVGSVFDPGVSGASTFQRNQDGLIAALNLTTNRNFTPEATLTVDANGVLTLGDLVEPNRNFFVTAF